MYDGGSRVEVACYLGIMSFTNTALISIVFGWICGDNGKEVWSGIKFSIGFGIFVGLMSLIP